MLSARLTPSLDPRWTASATATSPDGVVGAGGAGYAEGLEACRRRRSSATMRKNNRGSICPPFLNPARSFTGRLGYRTGPADLGDESIAARDAQEKAELQSAYMA